VNDLSGLFGLIAAQHTPGAWTSLEKAQCLAALVVGLRPRLVVEIGVWRGDSLIPMCLALQYVGTGTAIAIDPWSAPMSVIGQNQTDAAWWGEQVGQAGHEQAYADFVARLDRLGARDACAIVRAPSDDVNPGDLPPPDLLHVDGNHAEQAIRDVERFGARLPVGGVLVMDDVDWAGGHVRRARDRALELGFVELYALGTGCVLQRRAP